jgi:membrane protein DedA with SNARE-associated domain
MCFSHAPDWRSVMKELIHQYGAWLVFALVFLESIGLPLPGEAILVSAAIFAGTTQDISIALVLLCAVFGAILGSMIGFWIGDRFGYPLLLRYGFSGVAEPAKSSCGLSFLKQPCRLMLLLIAFGTRNARLNQTTILSGVIGPPRWDRMTGPMPVESLR